MKGLSYNWKFWKTIKSYFSNKILYCNKFLFTYKISFSSNDNQFYKLFLYKYCPKFWNGSTKDTSEDLLKMVNFLSVKIIRKANGSNRRSSKKRNFKPRWFQRYSCRIQIYWNPQLIYNFLFWVESSIVFLKCLLSK